MATIANRPLASSALSFRVLPSASLMGPLAFGTPKMPACS